MPDVPDARLRGVDAVVLAGGAARRLGGVDKPMVPVLGRPLLLRVLDAVAGAGTVVVVGPPRDLADPVRVSWVREQPPGGGPAAALGAGLPLTSAPVVLVLAADLPFAAEAVRPLLAALDAAPAADGAVLVDASGRDQQLAGAYRRAALAGRLAASAPLDGVAVRRVVGPLDLVRVPAERAGVDCDTWEDVRRAEALGGADGPGPRGSVAGVPAGQSDRQRTQHGRGDASDEQGGPRP